MNEKNTTIALKCYQKAADKGNLKAMLKLAEIYEGGRIVKKDFNKSFELYLQAADSGNHHARAKIFEIKKLIEQDIQKRAAEKLRQLEAMKVQNKISKAKTKTLPEMLPDNADTTQQLKSHVPPSSNAEKSKEFYELGLKYCNGDGVPKNDYLAMEHFTTATNGGNIKVMVRLGFLYRNQSDLKKSLQCFFKPLKTEIPT